MGIPNYVPDAKKIWGSDYSMDQGKSSLPNANYEQNEKNRVSLDDKLDRARNQAILGRPTPAFTDTTPYFDQVGQARQNQLASLDNLRNSALGLGPSFANAQAGQALGARLNAMAPQGNALAQRAMMLGGNSALGGAAAQGAQARGTEMGNALNAYGTGAQAIRGGDLAGQGAAAEQIARRRALDLAGAKSNQGLTQGFEGLEMDSNIAKTKSAQDFYDYWVKEQGAVAQQNAATTGTAISTAAAIAAMMLAFV